MQMYCYCFKQFPCFTDRQIFRAVAINLRSIPEIEILSAADPDHMAQTKSTLTYDPTVKVSVSDKHA